MKSQVKNRTEERKDLWEVWASPADALRKNTDRVHGGAEGSSTYCSLEDQEGPPYMQDDPV